MEFNNYSLYQLFKIIDSKLNDFAISNESWEMPDFIQLCNYFHLDLSMDQVEVAFNQWDLDHNGKITFDEVYYILN